LKNKKKSRQGKNNGEKVKVIETSLIMLVAAVSGFTGFSIGMLIGIHYTMQLKGGKE